MRVCRVQCAWPLAFAGLALLVSTSVGAGAEGVCTDPQSASIAEICNEPLNETDLSAGLETGTVITKPLIDQPSLTPTETQQAVPLPFANVTGETGLTAKTSLNGLRDYTAKRNAKKIENAKTRAGQPLKIPKPAVQQRPDLDVWAGIDAQNLSGPSDQTVRRQVGAGYRVSRQAAVGLMVEDRETTPAALPLPQPSRQDESIAAYFALKPMQSVTIDTVTDWEQQNTTASGPTTPDQKRSLTVSPRIRFPFAIEGGKTIEPYLTAKQEIGVTAANEDRVDTAGAGVTFAKPDTFSLNLSTDVDASDREGPAKVKSQLQFKVPLK